MPSYTTDYRDGRITINRASDISIESSRHPYAFHITTQLRDFRDTNLIISLPDKPIIDVVIPSGLFRNYIQRLNAELK
jgi:hypothetical protein